MGRGSSKTGAKGGGAFTKTSVTVQSGDEITLDQPLVYGAKDPAISGAVRKAVEAQEQKRLSAKSEYGYMVDKNGNPIGTEVHGGKGSVHMPYGTFQTPGGTFTHNHPRGKGEEGYLGGTFSPADMKTFADNKFWTIRASAAEGTYSMSKTLKFDHAGFKSYVASVDKTANAKCGATIKALNAAVKGGKIKYSEYLKSYRNAFNTFLVDVHNGYLAGQKKYGYTYTLEGK